MEYSRKKIGNFVSCSVHGCYSSNWKNPTIRFFQFPKYNKSFVKIKNKATDKEEFVDRLTVWKKILRISKKVTPRMKVCSLHFKEDDFIKSHKNLHGLKKIAVPSINLPTSLLLPKPKIPRKPPKKKEKPNEENNDNNNINTEPAREEPSDENNLVISTPEEVEITELNKLTINRETIVRVYPAKHRGNQSTDLGENHATAPPKPLFWKKKILQTFSEEPTPQFWKKKILVAATEKPKSKYWKKEIVKTLKEKEEERLLNNSIGIQFRSDFCTTKFGALINTETDLKTITGIPKFSILSTIEELVKMIRHPYCPREKVMLDFREIIIMTFFKLNRDLPYDILAILFGFDSAKICEFRILEMINILYVCLKTAILWPHKNQIMENLPKSFDRYKNVRMLLDCIEIPILPPTDTCCKIMTYSNRENCFTIKFMISVTPAGFVSYVSDPHGGNISDDEIFKQSGILEKFEEGDGVMVNDVFTIDEICKKNGIEAITAPFAKVDKEVSKTEALLALRMAKRLKQLKVLEKSMPNCLLSKIDKIFTIACAISNMSTFEP